MKQTFTVEAYNDSQDEPYFTHDFHEYRNAANTAELHALKTDTVVVYILRGKLPIAKFYANGWRAP